MLQMSWIRLLGILIHCSPSPITFLIINETFTSVSTENLEILSSNNGDLSIRHLSVGDIWSVICKTKYDIEAIYTSPNRKIDDIT